MRNSCINHPPKEPLIVIHQWQVEICEGNTTAAALLSFFEYWHNIKSEMRSRTSRSNDIAEMHGDERIQDETLLQFHTEEELISGIMIAKRDTIRKALSYLSDTGFISIHSNPNPKYAFDKTRYFLFHPEPINQWLREKRPPAKDPLTKSKNQHGSSSSENRRRREESRPTQSRNHSAITETSSETSSEITNSPLTPQRGEEGVHESKADDFQQEQEEESEAVVVEAEIVTEEEIKNKIDPSVESGKQPIQSINSNPGVDLGSALSRDNNAIPAQKLERIKRNIELLDSGKVERLPRHEFNEVAEYVIGPYASLYRKSGKLNNRERVNDIKPEFLAYVEKNVLSSKLRNEGNAVKYVRNSELDPDRWESLIADVKGWLKQEYQNLGQPTQTPKEKHQTQEELRKMMLSTRI